MNAMAFFTRNHLPVLHEQVKSSRMPDVRVQVPRFHGDGRADGDVMVMIVYRHWAATGRRWKSTPTSRSSSGSFPDQARHSEDERRRFTPSPSLRRFAGTCRSQNPTQGLWRPAQSGSDRGLLRRLIRRG